MSSERRFSELLITCVINQINADHRTEMLDLAYNTTGTAWGMPLHANLRGIPLQQHATAGDETTHRTSNPLRRRLNRLIAHARAWFGGRRRGEDHRDIPGRNLGLSAPLYQYLLGVSLREPDVLRRLRAETATLAEGAMQIGPEQGQFLALLLKLIGARRVLEIGTFTGYSALWMALALRRTAS